MVTNGPAKLCPHKPQLLLRASSGTGLYAARQYLEHGQGRNLPGQLLATGPVLRLEAMSATNEAKRDKGVTWTKGSSLSL